MTFSFNGKIAVITGAAGFIGRTFSKKFCSLGGVCILVDSNMKGLKVLHDELTTEYGREHLCIQCDLGDEVSRAALIEQISLSSPSIDVLVNNAAFTGMTEIDGWCVPFREQNLSAWNKAIEVNLTAVFHLCRELAPCLKMQDNSSIINVASMYGIIGPDMSLYEDTEMGNPAAYAASKAGVVQLTRWLSNILAPDIRVNSVSPGGVYRAQPKIFIDRYIQKTPLGRMCSEDEVVGGLLFLASDLASYITGHNLIVDGGYTNK